MVITANLDAVGYYLDLRKRLGTQGPMIVTTANVVEVDAAGRVLLHRRKDTGQWDVPSGLLEQGETLEDAGRRETREETGLEVGTLTLVDVLSGPSIFHEYPHGDQVYAVAIVYVTRDARRIGEPDPAETTNLDYFDPRALPDDLDNVGRMVLDTYLARHG